MQVFYAGAHHTLSLLLLPVALRSHKNSELKVVKCHWIPPPHFMDSGNWTPETGSTSSRSRAWTWKCLFFCQLPQPPKHHALVHKHPVLKTLCSTTREKLMSLWRLPDAHLTGTSCFSRGTGSFSAQVPKKKITNKEYVKIKRILLIFIGSRRKPFTCKSLTFDMRFIHTLFYT